MIPPWPGALWRAENGNQYRVNRVREDGWLYLVSHDWGNSVDWYNPIGGAVDLTDPDTFRGAVARLAEQLGAPADAIARGVIFHLVHNGEWVMFVGASFVNTRFMCATTDPAEALGAWWASMEKL